MRKSLGVEYFEVIRYIVGPLIGTILAVLLQRLMVTGVSRHKTEAAGEGDGKTDNKEE